MRKRRLFLVHAHSSGGEDSAAAAASFDRVSSGSVRQVPSDSTTRLAHAARRGNHDSWQKPDSRQLLQPHRPAETSHHADAAATSRRLLIANEEGQVSNEEKQPNEVACQEIAQGRR